MAFYYAMTEVLDAIDQANLGTDGLAVLAPVYSAQPPGSGRAKDVFQLTSHPKLLDLTRQDSAQELTALITEAPLYALSLELALDSALFSRDKNKQMDEALRRAFGHDPVPGASGQPWSRDEDGALQHPGLGHMDRARLCEIYIGFLNAWGSGHKEGPHFGNDVIGKHPERFLSMFEGYITPQGSRIRASILLAFGIRLDHDPGKPLENYVAAGHKKAARLRIGDPLEMLWAWLEADHGQMIHCRDLDRALRVEGLPRRPNWIRYDVFSLLEMEALKQSLAEQYIKADPSQRCLDGAPSIARAVHANAEGRVDDTLQQLLAESLNTESGYAGSARRFADAASSREKESARLAGR